MTEFTLVLLHFWVITVQTNMRLELLVLSLHRKTVDVEAGLFQLLSHMKPLVMFRFHKALRINFNNQRLMRLVVLVAAQ